MKFSDIRGNETASGALRSMVDSGRVPHALMFHEDPACGALPLSTAFLQYLFCEHRHDGEACGECPSCRQIEHLVHPDVHYVFPVNTGSVIKGDHAVSEMGLPEFRELYASNPFFTEQELYQALGMDNKAGIISVNEAKSMLSELSLSSVLGGYRALVVFLPERMNASAANKLLKVLEEPPAMTVFILISQSPEDVMTTISSRCQHMRVLPPERGRVFSGPVPAEIVTLWNELLEALISRKLLSALDCADRIAQIKSRDRLKLFCAYASVQIRKIFLTSRKLEDIAYVEPDEKEAIQTAAQVLGTKFCTRAIANMDRASMLIGRNVSVNMVMTDLVNRLYVNL